MRHLKTNRRILAVAAAACLLCFTIAQAKKPGNPGGGGSDYASFVCYGAPGFSLGALSWDYSSHTWHTHRDTFDKLIFDDLKNNAVLTASLVYLASEDPEFVDRTRRTVITGRGGRPRQWPTCQPATRSSRNSTRM